VLKSVSGSGIAGDASERAATALSVLQV